MRVSLTVMGVLWSTSLAFAQAPGDQPPSAPPAPVPAAEPAPVPAAAVAPVPVEPPARPTTVDRGTYEDANAGRAWLSPTALTPPAGTWSFEDFELFLIGASYAVSDNFVVTATTMVPVSSDVYWGFLSAKLQVVKQGSLRVAIQAGLVGVLENDSSGTTTTSTSTSGGDVGAAATLCLDDGCFSHLDGFVGAAFAYQDNASVPVGFSASFVQRVGKHVKLVLEADTAHLFGNIDVQADGFLGWYGLRFTSRNLAVDAGLVKPFCSDCSSDAFPLGYPVVSFSYRGLD